HDAGAITLGELLAMRPGVCRVGVKAPRIDAVVGHGRAGLGAETSRTGEEDAAERDPETFVHGVLLFERLLRVSAGHRVAGGPAVHMQRSRVLRPSATHFPPMPL